MRTWKVLVIIAIGTYSLYEGMWSLGIMCGIILGFDRLIDRWGTFIK